MPGRNGTGPMGMGPMTGRGMGVCAGGGVPTPANQVPGWGFGMGAGLGRGFRGGGGRGCRNGFYATGLPGWQRAAGWPMGGGVLPYAGPTPDQELSVLKNQASSCEGALGELRKRIGELEAEKAEK